MGHLKEPKGVYLTVSPEPLSAEERERLSGIIADYRATGRKPQGAGKTPTTKKPQTQKTKG